LCDSPVDILVPEFREACGEKKSVFIEYRINCHARDSGRLLISTWQRYREFEKLNKELATVGAPLLALPGKKWVGSVDVEARRMSLQRALQLCAKSEDSLPIPLAKFLTHVNKSSSVVPPGKKRSDSEGLIEAVAALHAATTSADKIMVDRGLQDELKKLGAVLLVAVAPLYMSCSQYSEYSSILLLGAFIGLCICICVCQEDARRRVAAMHAVKEKALELSTLARSMTESFSLCFGVDQKIKQATTSDPKIKSCLKVSESATMAQKVENPNLIQVDRKERQSTIILGFPAEPNAEEVRMWADRCCETVSENLQDGVNCYGMPWDVVKSGRDLQIWSSKVPGEAGKCWKMQFNLSTGITLEQLAEYQMNWDMRLKWDKGMQHGEVLKTLEDGHDICRYATYKILTVAPREFVDFRGCRISPDGKSLTHYFASLTEDHCAPTQDKCRGQIKIGTGVRYTVLPLVDPSANGSAKRQVRVEIVAEADPKGSLPMWLVNNAYTLQLNDTYKAMTTFFNKL